MSVNKVILIGNVGQDPRVKYFDTGSAVATFPLATTDRGYTLANGNTLFVLAEGRLVNLAAGDGHPAEIMDLSFALQALALDYVQTNAEWLSPKVYVMPKAIDEKVARIKLAAMHYAIDTLTSEQYAYLYEEGSAE